MANSVDPDETARYEPSHLDLESFHVLGLVCRAEMLKIHSQAGNSVKVVLAPFRKVIVSNRNCSPSESISFLLVYNLFQKGVKQFWQSFPWNRIDFT